MNIEEVKVKALHTGLLDALCAIKFARNKVFALMGDEEIKNCSYTDQVDKIVGELNEQAAALNEVLSIVTYCRLDNVIDKHN